MEDPDQYLVHEAQAGKKEAFGKLVDQYYEMVYAVAFGVVGNREDALDATQDVFTKVYQQLRRFEGNSKFKTWLYRVAVNVAIDIYRKRRPTEPVDESLHLESKIQSPGEHVRQNELMQLVKQALDELTPEHRAVLVMREWQDMSYEEIAEALGIEIGTVMSRIFYARKKIGEVLTLHIAKADV
ncbi:MAG: hypothetical protein A3G33_05030 [Omnitrophica bacterium RIFCSPLOWO2_12_FULL_44_17]|uniref:RNA polymerase subunit sigma-24 n=1 Tax=Candidatus Danuiimicrobium aquiferis TaxID=1801832 RepID=A0A1G1KX60_9BACT|nr:MAG: hypothetical protein A3B72_01400 [Omnitrophica bacterium RIFCSPHIGHO2_02_FULL_45_28]OGW89141.1 MAG: hypothetical protein A3E74_06195 [Omnitrophica bacterium RIFCSPHIGHO2_12_FULL_44_12]OGW97520.1 MAG: hypothetical protein A3G33_05030 [Omnitrophica bacterium RIFCSPLOWO2_12_FULL_44_17]OGX02074.1 MAG: hypothetical protein A3J12_06325 [Omnitrophica bacterium RIFCSPLOWO2_02_FULL_44_11]